MLLTSRHLLLPLAMAMLSRVQVSLAMMARASAIMLLAHHTLFAMAVVTTSLFYSSTASWVLMPSAIITMAATSIFRFSLCDHLDKVLSFKPVTSCSVVAMVAMPMAVTMTWAVVIVGWNPYTLYDIVVASSPVVAVMWTVSVTVAQSLVPFSVGVVGFHPWGWRL